MLVLIGSFMHALTLVLLNKFLIFSQSDYLIKVVDINSYIMANSGDPDQLASSEAN